MRRMNVLHQYSMDFPIPPSFSWSTDTISISISIFYINDIKEGVSAGCLAGHCRPRPGAKADKVDQRYMMMILAMMMMTMMMTTMMIMMMMISGVQRVSGPKCWRVRCNGHLLGLQCLASVIVIILTTIIIIIMIIIIIILITIIIIMVIVIIIRIIVSDGQNTFQFCTCKDRRCGTMLSGPPDSANNYLIILSD